MGTQQYISDPEITAIERLIELSHGKDKELLELMVKKYNMKLERNAKSNKLP